MKRLVLRGLVFTQDLVLLFLLAARLCVQSLVLRDWCLGFALLLGCAQDFVLLFLVAARLCVKRLVLRVWCLGFALLLGCLQGWLLKVSSLGSWLQGSVLRVWCLGFAVF